MNVAAHDPGGKVRLALQDGIYGGARFSPCGRYRQTLTRAWGEPSDRFALWIGCNPSTADAEVDDPTCRREVIYTRDRLKLPAYVKTNVFDYRATDPKELLRLEPEQRSSGLNLKTIIDLAGKAQIVIAAWGALAPPLQRNALVIESAMASRGIKLFCVGYTKSGGPRHPLYVKGNAELLPYPREGFNV